MRRLGKTAINENIKSRKQLYQLSAFYRPELKDRCSIVRELHVYGSVVPVNARDPTKFQHQGFGMLLMEEAERIAREEHQSHKIAVISGVNFNQTNHFLVTIHSFLFRRWNKKLLQKNGLRTGRSIHVQNAYRLQIRAY